MFLETDGSLAFGKTSLAVAWLEQLQKSGKSVASLALDTLHLFRRVQGSDGLVQFLGQLRGGVLLRHPNLHNSGRRWVAQF
ncbi:MAG TPA: hypothetical protein VNO32_18345 [Candidatus Acidoferrum sp.]|nr:hypothetical protein [Candidatus Acidoferrum sp.]